MSPLSHSSTLTSSAVEISVWKSSTSLCKVRLARSLRRVSHLTISTSIAIRFIKFSASEQQWLARIDSAREEELKWLFRTRTNYMLMNVSRLLPVDLSFVELTSVFRSTVSMDLHARCDPPSRLRLLDQSRRPRTRHFHRLRKSRPVHFVASADGSPPDVAFHDHAEFVSCALLSLVSLI